MPVPLLPDHGMRDHASQLATNTLLRQTAQPPRSNPSAPSARSPMVPLAQPQPRLLGEPLLRTTKGTHDDQRPFRVRDESRPVPLDHAHAHLAQAQSPITPDDQEAAAVQQALRTLKQQTADGTPLDQAVGMVNADPMLWPSPVSVNGQHRFVSPKDMACAALVLEAEKHRPLLADGRDPIVTAARTLEDREVLPASLLQDALREMSLQAPELDAQAIIAAWEVDRELPDSMVISPLRDALGAQLVRLDSDPSHATLLTDPRKRGLLWRAQHELTQAIEQHTDVERLGDEVAREIEAAIASQAVKQAYRGGLAPVNAAHVLSYVLEWQQAGPDSTLYRDLLRGDSKMWANDAAVYAVLDGVMLEVDAKLHSGHPPAERLKLICDRIAPYRDTALYQPLVEHVLQNRQTRRLFNQLNREMRSGNGHDHLARSADILETARGVPAIAEALYRAELTPLGSGRVPRWVHRAPSNEHSRDYYTNLSRIYAALGGAESYTASELREAVLQRLTSDNAVHSGTVIDRRVPGGAPSHSSYATTVRTFGLEPEDKGSARLQLMRDIADSADTPAWLRQEITREIGSVGARAQGLPPLRDAELMQHALH